MNLFFAIHLDVYERVGFKVGMTSHSIELYILILVLLTLTFNKVTGVQKKQTNMRQLSHKVSITLDDICYTVVKPILILFRPFKIQRKEAYICDFVKQQQQQQQQQQLTLALYSENTDFFFKL